MQLVGSKGCNGFWAGETGTPPGVGVVVEVVAVGAAATPDTEVVVPTVLVVTEPVAAGAGAGCLPRSLARPLPQRRHGRRAPGARRG